MQVDYRSRATAAIADTVLVYILTSDANRAAIGEGLVEHLSALWAAGRYRDALNRCLAVVKTCREAGIPFSPRSSEMPERRRRLAREFGETHLPAA